MFGLPASRIFAPIAVFAGPCVLESRGHALETASALKEIAERLNIGLVYKSSFDKANRTSISSARGLGLKDALPVFAEIRETLGLPVVTDVHEREQCTSVTTGRPSVSRISDHYPLWVEFECRD